MESAAHEKPGVVAVASCQHAQEVKVASAYNQPSRSVGLGRSSSWMITTSAPVYPPTDGGFVGWFQNGTDASRYWCGGDETYDTASTASTQGRCCTPGEGECAPATRCDGTTKVYANGDTVLCSETKSCVEATIYEDQQSSEDGDAATMAACVRSPYATAYYRTAITTFTTDVPDDFSSSSSIPPPTATPIDSATDDTTDNTEGKDSESGKDNKGAIIGGTIGGVAGLVLIILAACRKNKGGSLSRDIDKLVESFIRNHPPPEPGSWSGEARLPYPVILPQRRPSSRKRGFIRAYAPVLEGFGIDQTIFLDFLDTAERAGQARPWMNAINLASFGTAMLPSGISIATSIAVQMAVKTAVEVEGRRRTNTFFDAVNDGYFRPRGLYCLVMTSKPESSSPYAVFDLNAAIEPSLDYGETGLLGKFR
ncbi:hypothetical protein ASPVEDRAFT_87088 [Aspergillus versicolor CBS 583.65]|uniref:Uncharacterized protein n=1 Tax=Aspergillus versicolor CBS 583.65 TaxID=1036611 RepID=A0A1L9PWD4_ASPVE|nr:uncharacterized protein ASPVEDRAFT_87088 [Aspergillus versicolor CBS 583.65]OJJ05752.1 hypothetical protein ASPVEDRAFT_87088 [Aspergillus versicolor CBS 583.65]